MVNTPDILRCVLRLYFMADQDEFQAALNTFEYVWLNENQVNKISTLN